MCNKTKQLKQQKATEMWLLVVGARLPTPIVGGVPEYRLG